MANATIRTASTTLPAPPATAVAPFILERVGDVARPRALLQATADLRHLPGEMGPLVGVRNIFAPQRRGVAHYVELQQRYGSVFRMQIGPIPLVVVASPELLTEILRNEDGAWSTALAWHAFFAGMDSTAETMDLLLTLDFEPHREARKLMQPAFSAAATASYLEMAQPLFERAIEGWLARGETAFKPEIRRLLATVSAQTFLGIADPAEGAMLDRALADIWGGTIAITKNRWLSPSWRRAVRAHRRLRELLKARVSERRARGGDDLFSRLCVETRGAQFLDDDGIVRLFVTVLLGAFDTTALGLASMAYLLARHPDWQDRLRQEALGVARGRISYDDVKRLELTECAWKETLRLMPVTGHMFRLALRDVELHGKRIPAGAYVLVTNGPLGRDARWWSDPTRFDPTRFGVERAEDKKHKGSFLPFGGGAHACIGTHLANAEARAFWHAMLTRCRFRLQPDYEARHTYLPLGCVSGPVGLAVEAAQGAR
jgi:cytochrome P450